MADQELDARGLTCPLPVMRAAKIMLSLKAGQTLHIVATDPSTVLDFDAYARGSGNTLIESNKTEKGEFEFLLKRV